MLLSLMMILLLAGCGGNEEPTVIRVGSLKGPTSMGLVELMNQDAAGTSQNDYEFTMEAAADTLLGLMVQNELDIALVPANVASVLYQKTEGNICVIDINTLGVLYMVSADTTITDIASLEGRTIYLTGKGTTPDFVIQYLLAKNGVDINNVTLEYKSEATEVAAVLAENPDAVGLLPQPFVTSALQQNDSLSMVLDLTQEWNRIQNGENAGVLVTGVTIVRKAFLEENPEAVAIFMEEHKNSAEFATTNVEQAAEYVAQYGIVGNAQIAAKAMPYCNIVYIDGAEMKDALSGYLTVLFEQDPTAVGGALPGEDFYYIAQ